MYNVRADDHVLRFMALGDWGGLPWGEFNYSTAIERGVADGMARLAKEKPQDFIIALGKILACTHFCVFQTRDTFLTMGGASWRRRWMQNKT